MNSDQMTGTLLIIIVLAIMTCIIVAVRLDYATQRQGMLLGYDQVTIPGYSSPVWQKSGVNNAE